MRHLPIRRLTLLMGCTLALAGIAAPTIESAPAPESNPASTSALGPAAVRPGARNSDARTIDLLVDMQQPGAGIQFNERASRGTFARDGQPRPSPTAPAAPAARDRAALVPAPVQQPRIEAPATPPSGLFGSGAVPAKLSPSSHQGADSPTAGKLGPAPAAGRPRSELPPELKRWLQWPREIVEYVRENRALVSGGTVVLLLMAWTGSVMFSRHRG